MNYLIIIFLFSIQNAIGNSLIDVYEKAVKNNPEYGYERQYEAAHAIDKNISRSAFFPTFNIGTSVNKNYLNGDKLSNARTVTLTTTQPIISFSKIYEFDIADHKKKISLINIEKAHQDLIKKCIDHYFNAIKSDFNLKVKNKYNATTKKTFAQVEQKFKIGMANLTDYNEAKAKLDLSSMENIKVRNQKEQALLELSDLINQDHFVLPNINKINSSNIKLETLKSYTRSSLRQNLSLKVEEHNKQIAKINMLNARSKFLPELSAVHSLSYTDKASEKKKSSLGLDLSWNVFNIGSKLSEKNKNKILYQAAGSKLIAKRRKTISQIKEIYRDILTAKQNIKASEQVQRSQKLNLRSIKQAYENGLKGVNDLLMAKASLVDSEYKVFVAKLALLENYLELKLVLNALTVKDIKDVDSILIKDSI